MEKVFSNYVQKICDGIFVGNMVALEFSGFISNNKIKSVVNCSACEFEVPQYFNTLRLYWKNRDDQIVVNSEIVEQIFNFVTPAQQKGESVLFCSTAGESRALSAIIGYFMIKFSWSLYKTLQFVNSSRTDYQIKASYLQQFIEFEKYFFYDKVLTRRWDSQVDNKEEQILQNTYLNSVQNLKSSFHQNEIPNLSLRYTKRSICWSKHIVLYIEENDSYLKTVRIPEKSKHRSILKKKNELNDLKVIPKMLYTNQGHINNNLNQIFKRKNSQQRKKQQTLQPRSKTPTLANIPKTLIDVSLQIPLLCGKSQLRTPSVQSRSLTVSPEISPIKKQKQKLMANLFEENSRTEKVRSKVENKIQKLFKLK